MTPTAFDGSSYRREVLSHLRERNPAEVDDLFWLAHVPRELEDDAAIADRLRESKGFLNKERTRARQAAVAAAVLREWPRIESTLTDAGARRALLDRLRTATPEGERIAPIRRRTRRTEDAEARRRRQAAANLAELARLRADPDLAVDLFVFLGLPPSATSAIIEQRLAKVGEVNRRRRPDRERTLVDELLVQARQLLLGAPAGSYLASLGGDARDAAVDALLAGDVVGALRERERAHEHDVDDTMILAALAAPAREVSTVVPVSELGLGIWCPSCGTIVPLHASTCSSCAASTHLACTSCRTVNVADAVACVSCATSLDQARRTLVEQRAEREAERQALLAVDAAPESERQVLLQRLAREHPAWRLVRDRIAGTPPGAPAHVALVIADGTARLTWPKSSDPSVDAYLVERHEQGGSRVLGRTAVTTWTDGTPATPNVTWSVRALRGEWAASSATTARPGTPTAERAPAGKLSDVRAIGGPAIELSWTAPVGADVAVTRVERRPEGDVHRRLSVDPDGYRDRQVAIGRTYEYRLSLAGDPGPPTVLVVTAGDGRTAIPSACPPRPSRRPGSSPAPRAAGVGVDAAVDRVTAVRDGDGRLRVRWRWPRGVTEAWVAHGPSPPLDATAPGRKVTNMRYDLDDGVLLEDVATGAHIAVFAGRRDSAGTLRWGPAQPRSRVVAP